MIHDENSIRAAQLIALMMILAGCGFILFGVMGALGL